MLSVDLDILAELFEAHRSDANAGAMENYMRGQFPFFGIKAPLRKELVKQYFQETGILKEPFNQELMWALWEKDEREYQAAALDYLGKSLNKLKKGDLPFLERLITTKSWWDTVDMIAAHAVGKIAQKFPDVAIETIDDWAEHENIWLRRTAILFQLKYKDKTDAELLYRYIRQNAESKEFFIQKAIGWALREYSKTNSVSVKAFIEGQKLAPLSVREGSKYLP